MLQYLLDNGASLFLEAREGETPLRIGMEEYRLQQEAQGYTSPATEECLKCLMGEGRRDRAGHIASFPVSTPQLLLHCVYSYTQCDKQLGSGDCERGYTCSYKSAFGSVGMCIAKNTRKNYLLLHTSSRQWLSPCALITIPEIIPSVSYM